MNVKAVIAPILLLALLTGCTTLNPTRSPAAGGTASPTPATLTDSGTPTSASPGEAITAPAETGGGVEVEPGKTASRQDTEQVLNDILNQLDQLDRLYSELDEVSEDDLNLNE